MKKVKVMLVATALLIGSLASAATVTNPVNDPATSAEIGELLKDPGFEVNNELTAMVTFMINDDQELVVLSVDTDNYDLERFVKSRLNYKKVDTSLEEGKAYMVPVRVISEES